MQAHGGWLWAENNTNGGATFYFTVPLEQNRRESRPADADFRADSPFACQVLGSHERRK
jgi:hypothetical protein